MNFHIDEKRDAYTYVFMDAHAIQYMPLTRACVYIYIHTYMHIDIR